MAVFAAAATLLSMVLVSPSMAVAAPASEGKGESASAKTVSSQGVSTRGSDATFVSAGPSTDGTTYYVDNANGNDANDGKSPQAAWKNLTKVSAQTYAPGDHILLESGSTWNGQTLMPKGNGVNGKPIVVDLYTRSEGGAATYTASKRPVINGNGTENVLGTFKRYISGAVQLTNQEYWSIRDLEVTNTPELSNPNGYKKPGDKQRAGILLLGYGLHRNLNGVTVENDYVHDVQSEYYLKAQHDGLPMKLKHAGGIIALGYWINPDGNPVDSSNRVADTGFSHLTMQNNIVQRVGLEGLRTKAESDTGYYPKLFTDVIIKNNYLENVAGDAIVMSEVGDNGLIEGNIVVHACAADYGTQNYAALWVMASHNVLAQYNEVYGNRFGYNDAEAFDIDMQSSNVTYQYNYSHGNGGGFMLLMSDQANSTVRYNISANDGGGNAGTNADGPGAGGYPYTYKEQSLFHYWIQDDGAAMPNIYNNTFYVGDGVTTSLFGEGNNSDSSGVIAHFNNNVVAKAGAGKVKFLSNYPPNGNTPTEHNLHANAASYLNHNLFSTTDIASAASGTTVSGLQGTGNVFADPKLAIETEANGVGELDGQINTVLDNPATSLPWANPKERLRQRASLFKIAADSPAVAKGQKQEGMPGEDLFGDSTLDRGIDIGAHQVSDHEIRKDYTPETVNVTTPAGVYPQLPQSINVTIKETVDSSTTQRTENHAVKWDYVKQDDYKNAGTITVYGAIDGITDVKAKATVTVTGALGAGTNVQSSFTTTGDATVQRGSADTAMGAQAGNGTASSDPKSPFGMNYSNNLVLRLKNSASPNYNRRFYVKFDPSAYAGRPNEIKNAKLRVYVNQFNINTSAGSTPDEQLRNTAFRVDAYATDANWEANTVTWNNGPGNNDVTTANHQPLGSGENIPTYGTLKPAGSRVVTNGEIIDNQYALDIDVTQYLQSLGTMKPVSFLVDVPMSDTPNFNRDNAGFDAFSTEGARQAFIDHAVGTFKLPASMSGFTMTADALAPKLLISDSYISSVTPVEATIKPGQVPTLPDKVHVTYSDGRNMDVPVTWPTFDAQSFTTDGDFTVSADVPQIGRPVAATIHVKSDAITSLDPLPALDRPVGLSRTQLGMPSTIVAHLASGGQVTLNIPGWDDDPSNYTDQSAPGTYHFPGSLVLPLGISNPDGLKPRQEVRTHPIPATIKLALPAGSVGPIVAGKQASVHFALDVTGKAPYTQTDDWGKAVRWSLTRVDASSASAQDAAQGESQGKAPSRVSVQGEARSDTPSQDESLSQISAQGETPGEPTIDQSGTLTVPADAETAEYEVTATSQQVPGLSGLLRVGVQSLSDYEQAHPSGGQPSTPPSEGPGSGSGSSVPGGGAGSGSPVPGGGAGPGASQGPGSGSQLPGSSPRLPGGPAAVGNKPGKNARSGAAGASGASLSATGADVNAVVAVAELAGVLALALAAVVALRRRFIE
ncbi:Ig-like domain-containing protein [Bifidobacterium sp. ESL0728]|uniref:Ig-like domain-containing protein n=1 Tax=Bifidobacterium sp. ESL0728 TaxID=2983220 RepID=UPI0023F92AD6|nr:Ig-like domain-containing protein [Bifidobacterium sp. ESL0728]WEV59152.1 Ig-like domain-containing protein [Bifidobacterium sp. ESL0728]